MVAEIADGTEFRLPSLGSDMDEGTVLEWLVEPGHHVSKGDVLLRVDTEKAEIDVEIWHEAVIAELLVGPGDTVPVGTPLALLSAGSSTTSKQPATESPARTITPGVEPPATESPARTITPGVEPPASEPPARTITPGVEPPARIAPTRHLEPGIDREQDRTTAPVSAGPRMVFWPSAETTTSPPESSVPAARPVAAGVRTEPDRSDRRQAAVADLMARSNNEIPHFHVVRQIDLTGSLARLEQWNDSVPPPDRILPAALLLYATARAAHGSVINGTYVDGPVDAEAVDLGVAVHVRGGGLMTPVLPGADTLALDSLMVELQAMVARARSGRLSSRDMTSATLTVTNLSHTGADRVLGIIRPPERALIGFGRISQRPAVVDGVIAPRSMVDTTLTADHRVVNGQAGARFLDRLNTILTRPEDITFAGGTS